MSAISGVKDISCTAVRHDADRGGAVMTLDD